MMSFLFKAITLQKLNPQNPLSSLVHVLSRACTPRLPHHRQCERKWSNIPPERESLHHIHFYLQWLIVPHTLLSIVAPQNHPSRLRFAVPSHVSSLTRPSLVGAYTTPFNPSPLLVTLVQKPNQHAANQLSLLLPMPIPRTVFLISLLLLILRLPRFESANHDYSDALSKCILFFEGQRSGFLPNGQRISWRANSGLSDGWQRSVDLTGGYYDAGDNIKFGFPMAFTTTMLAWSVIEFGDSMPAGELRNTMVAIRWATDYLLKTVSQPGRIFVQVRPEK